MARRIETRRVDFTLPVDIPFSERVRRLKGRCTRRLKEFRSRIASLTPTIPTVGMKWSILFMSSATHILLFFWIGWTWTILFPDTGFYNRMMALLCGFIGFWISSHIILKAFEGSNSSVGAARRRGSGG